jgi:hypothetical protein
MEHDRTVYGGLGTVSEDESVVEVYEEMARAALTAAEKVRAEAGRKQQSLDDARINKALYGEARTQADNGWKEAAERFRETGEVIAMTIEARTQERKDNAES